MKRSIFTILITALLLTGLMVSCNSDVSVEQPISGELVAISFDNGGSKGLTASLEAFNKGDYYWAYAAKKSDSSNLISGQTANYGEDGEVRVWVKTDNNNKPIKGLGETGTSGYEAYKVPGFSQGYWNFKLYAYKGVLGDNPDTEVVETDYVNDYVLVYQGETLNALLKSDSVNAQGSHLVSVTVNPVQSEGNGTMVFLTNQTHAAADRISMNTVNSATYGTDYTVKVLSILSMEDYPVEYVDAAGAKIHEATDLQDGEYTLPAGSYKVTVSFTDAGNTVNYARGTIVATVYSNLTTTIGGDLTEAMTYAEFEENNDVSISDGTTTLYMPLGVFRDFVNSGNSYEGYTVTLLKDVDLGGNEWTPIGTSTCPFSGTFDGNGKTVSNLNIDANSNNGIGLFGYVNGASIKNLTLNNCSISNVNKDGGLLIGVADGGVVTVENCTTESNCTISGNDRIGGIIGRTTDTADSITVNMTNVTNKATVHGNQRISGFISQLYSENKAKTVITATINFVNCSNEGTISLNKEHDDFIISSFGVAAGFIAHANGLGETISYTNCINNGNIEAPLAADFHTYVCSDMKYNGKVDNKYTWSDPTNPGNNSLRGVVTMKGIRNTEDETNKPYFSKLEKLWGLYNGFDGVFYKTNTSYDVLFDNKNVRENGYHPNIPSRFTVTEWNNGFADNADYFGTYKISYDYEGQNTITLLSDISWTYTYNVGTSSNMTVDLNDHHLLGSDYKILRSVGGGSHLKLKNGTVDWMNANMVDLVTDYNTDYLSEENMVWTR